MDNDIRQNAPLIRLPLENVSNCRDLGGYPTEDGFYVKWHTFLRSNNLNQLSEKDKKYLLDYGVKTVIDLRTTNELIEEPNQLAKEPTIDYYHINLTGKKRQGESLVALRENGVEPQDLLKENYLVILKDSEHIKAVFDIFLKADNGTTIFHCSAGKDRTGLIAMLILGLAGVAKQDIISNYETSLTNIIDNYSDNTRANQAHVLSSNPENILKSINYILKEYGSFKSYFKWIGYSEEEISELKNKIIQK